MVRRAWLPHPAEVEQRLRRLYKVVPHDFVCIRAMVVADTIARSFGIVWSPHLARIVEAAVVRMGGRRVVLKNVPVWKRFMPSEFTLEEAVKLSARVRGIKGNPPRELVA